MQSIAAIRKDYKLKMLSENEVADSPFAQFAEWWDNAVKSELDEVNAMTLATATANGIPDARIVLLKEYSEEGFVFFTNYESRKGIELSENPRACLVFFWKELERQVRISGDVEKIPSSQSDAYFSSRPHDSQLGAWASPQSRVIADREAIEESAVQYQQQFGNENVPRPQNWGGYIVRPNCIEFWQGRPGRLHDRIQYSLLEKGGWRIERLAP